VRLDSDPARLRDLLRPRLYLRRHKSAFCHCLFVSRRPCLLSAATAPPTTHTLTHSLTRARTNTLNPTESLRAAAATEVVEAARATKERQTELRDEAQRVLRESHEKELAEARRQREVAEAKAAALQQSAAQLAARLDTLKGQLSVEHSEQLRKQEEDHLKAMQVCVLCAGLCCAVLSVWCVWCVCVRACERQCGSAQSLLHSTRLFMINHACGIGARWVVLVSV
jgi:hypothetical protein